ncbi:ATP-binding cassette sub-family A member 7-like [Varroa jacobsoni]|uniref:ATP-binding cassette sub-family A member 7-like n=1 Tax=Varroa jacobsoni TaxID=62625 RepID=UPI000BF66CF0|nr:ATP-binding cassette sub-family A member 7-like [Varroa jacobsoni]
MASVGVTFAVSYMLCNAVVLPIEERVAKVKLVQIMTGLPRWLYVFSNAVFDLLSMFVTVTIMVAIFVLVDPSNVYAVTQNLAALIAVLTLFCFSMLPQVYIITYIIDVSIRWRLYTSSIMHFFLLDLPTELLKKYYIV